MWGPSNALLEENLTSDQQGLASRVFGRLFARMNEEQIKHADKQLKYQSRCSFLEIYNEQITDLLNPSQKNLQIREDIKSGVYVENLTEKYVSTSRDVIHLLLKGMSNRRTGATSMNSESSRSHSVFTCVVESQCKSMSDGLSSFKTSRINLVDLAGSERQKLTGAAGERLKEAGNINKSLSQLGNLINILAEISQTGKQRHIPYRDSKLTFLLQESLGGNAKMAVICAVSSAKSCKSETFSTLRFAQRAKAIKNQAVVNEVLQDDVNFLRQVIKQLKDELLQMKAHGNHTDPNAACANSWNARRSLSLLKFSLNHPIVTRHVDDDGDEEMEIDEESIERLCAEVEFQSSGVVANQCADGIVKDHEHLGTQPLDVGEDLKTEVSDVIMEEGISEINDQREKVTNDIETPYVKSKFIPKEEEEILSKTNCKKIWDKSALPFPYTDTEYNPPSGSFESVAPTPGIVPCDVSPTSQPPTLTVSPEIISSSRKSLRTSSMLTASQKDIQCCEPGRKNAHSSLAKFTHRNSQLSLSTKSDHKTTHQLAASLHRGLEILDSHRPSLTFRKSALSFSLKAVDSKPTFPAQKVDVGVQVSPGSTELTDEDDVIHVCSNCKNSSLQGSLKEDNESNISDLDLVPVDRSMSGQKLMKQVPKAVVEKVLAGAFRREMEIEKLCVKQTSKITQLNRLVQQYKHERECNAIISQLREDKILRLENLMDGVLRSEDFMEEELLSLRKEHELLNEKYENHPEVLQTKVELMRIQNELEKYLNFFDMGERDYLLEEIHDLRCQLQYYTDSSLKASTHLKSLSRPTYDAPYSPLPFYSILETTEKNAAKEIELEKTQWVDVENQWICLAEELKAELEASCSQTERLNQDLEVEKKCSEELKEAMRLAMEGQARMVEQYADLEERHMQMLARQRKLQEGVGDVKKAAARAGVKRAESKFINALAVEISALKVEREKERQYWRDEKKTLQVQLRDTAEAVQAAGEILLRLQEAEEVVAAAEKRVALAEEESEKYKNQMETLQKKHELEVNTLNQIIAESRLPKETLQDAYHEANEAKYDEEDCQSAGDNRWKEEFEAFYNNDIEAEFSSKFREPSSWFSGYDKCNI